MNRYAIDLPKIGIRPCIDGRRNGVREGLVDQTMNMAKAAAKLIQDNIRYPNGDKVEIVLADTTIGGVREAAACQNKFEQAGVTITLSVSPCWCYSTEVMDFDPHSIKAVWVLTERSARARFFSRRCSRRTRKKACPPLASTGTT